MAELDGMKQAFEASCEQHLALSEQFRPSNIQTNLKVAILQAEEESENIVDDFLNSKFKGCMAKIFSLFSWHWRAL